MLLAWFFLTLAVVTLQGKQIDFERFEQLLETDFYNSTLRVRKYSGTVMTLNGTFQILQPLTKSLIISTGFFHSSLGNQQFNHYPMKLPTENVCDFVKSFYKDYGHTVANLANMPERGECPIKPRTISIVDKIFPADVVPRYAPPGLWKVHIINSLNDAPVAKFEIMAKIQDALLP
uniref:MD-2-related lipid-recognition domain-containing protein n=1 Tax=Anopheles farauti TaxID=69004 RepID=A0A182QI55_9DIPT